jgi:signal transduction histidine kinase
MAGHTSNPRPWIFAAAALAVWLAMGWPFLQELMSGKVRGSFPVPSWWLLPYTIFGATVVGATILNPRTIAHRALLCAQLAAVVAMTIVHPKDLMSIFLVIIAWQVAMMTAPAKALCWIAFQTLAVIGMIILSPNTHLSYIMVLSFVLQLCCVLTVQALKREAETARALGRANQELRSTQAIIASRVRDAECLRISQELHDAWGQELTALRLQLEIANSSGEPRRVRDHVIQAKGMSRDLLKKVRDVVATLREDECGDKDVDTGESNRGARSGSRVGVKTLLAGNSSNQHNWIFSLAALAVAFTLGWPVLKVFLSGKVPVSVPWIIIFAVFVAAVLGAAVLKLRPSIRWTLLCIQVAAVAGMAFLSSWPMMTAFLIIVAWQVAATTGPGKALSWVAIQTLAVIGALALTPNPDLCWVIGKAFALQLLFVFAAQALRREEQTARAFAQTNCELRSAQAMISNDARNAERLRVSRELHDAWGHELTALGLQLEIASHVADADRAKYHVMQAKDLARALLGKVCDVVATLHEDERCGLKGALETLARSVPSPAIHVSFDSGVQVSPDQAHALMRCAQEAVTNAIRHSQAFNLWLQVTSDGEGVRLVARNDGSARTLASFPGSGLLGMRERLENLGGQLAIGAGKEWGFTVDAWLPSLAPQPA